MPCYHPLFAMVDVGPFDELRLQGFSVEARQRDYELKKRQPYDRRPLFSDGPATLHRRLQFLKDFTMDDYLNHLKSGAPPGSILQLPCRKCQGCRLDHAHEWANRLLMELPYHESAWFLTLTYDDAHVPTSLSVDDATGELRGRHMTLRLDDLQRFLKRLRKNSKQSIRYYAAGEYGSKTFRPHYHLILYGLRLDDLHPRGSNFEGSQYFTSDLIDKCWPNGFHILGRVTWESAAYVARYTMKKAGDDRNDNYYEFANIEPEFQVMSRRPGIGYQFYQDHPDFFDYSSYNLSTPNGSRRIYPPAYFKKLRNSEGTESQRQLYERSQKLIANAEELLKVKAMLSDKSLEALSADAERQMTSRLSGLVRDTI